VPQLALLTLAILAYALTAVRLGRLSISGPIVLVTVGALLGPAGVGAVTAPATSEPFRVLAELTLALLLFSDASTIALREAGGIAWLPGRLLAIGLPLTIALGALLGWLVFPALGIGFALVLGSILAPTDAALSLPVLLDRAIPVRVRRAINIESGLNDGIATPFVTLSLAIAAAEETTGGQAWLIEAGTEIALAIIVAVIVGGLGGRLTAEARRRGWASSASESLAVVALAILAYAGATAVGGNGFVAAFGAGIAFRTLTVRSEPSVEFAESIGLAASYVVWLLFGVALAGPVITAGFDVALIGYALLSLTLVRMVPVAIALAGARLRPDTVAMIGWFGPRGLASVVFLLVAFDELGPAHPATVTLVQVVTWTVLLSALLHGLSAGPVGAWYGRRLARAGADDWELGGADEPRISHRHSLARPPTQVD
jgi:NhaP-type Na+/H+ or K+/H+ antiporter